MMQVIGSRVLIKPFDVKKKTESGLIIPDTVRMDRDMQEGLVVNISDVIDRNGNRIHFGFNVGDIVILAKSVGVKHVIDGIDHLICDVNDLWAVKAPRMPVKGDDRCVCGSQIVVKGDTTMHYELVDDRLHFQKKDPDIDVPFRCSVCGAITFEYRALRDIVMMYVMPLVEKIGSIYLPEDENYIGGNMCTREHKPYAVVLAVGSGYYDKVKKAWKHVQSGFSVGDVVFYEKRIPKGWSFKSKGFDGNLYEVRVCGLEDVYGHVGGK